MKKRIAALWLLALAALLTAMPALAAEEEEHTHIVSEWTVAEEGHSGVCEDCGETVTQTHNMNDGEVTAEPTCQAAGVRTFTCVDCGATEEEAIPQLTDHVCDDWTVEDTQHTGTCIHCGEALARTHTYDEGEVTLDPTCTAEGTKLYTCTACGHTKTEALPAVDHNMNDGEVTAEPTCQAAGVRTFTCVDCGATEEEAIPQLTDHVCNDWTVEDTQHTGTCIHCGEALAREHGYDDGVVTTDPTCQAEGVKTFTCTDCGHSYEEAVPQLTDHVGGDWSYDDTQHTGICIHCGEAVTGQHSYDEGVVTTEPTCQAEGVKTFTCVCGHSYEEAIPQLADHVYGDYTFDELQHTQQCIYCGHGITADHQWDEGVVTLEPTCTEDGVKLFSCLCGHTFQEVVAATGHSYGDWESTGEDNHQHSCACGDVVEQKHTWGKGVVTTQPTCDKKGVKTYTCTGCGETKTSQVDTLPHTYDHSCDVTCNACGHIRRTEHKYESTWTTDENSHWHECTVCGDDGSLQTHQSTEWIVDVPEGEYSEGQKHRDCSVCGLLLETQTIPATGCLHGNEELRGKKEPTCTEEGYTGDWTCPRCEAVLTPGEAIPMLPHSPGTEGRKEPTCTEEGYTGDEICQECGAMVRQGQSIAKLPHEAELIGKQKPSCTTAGYTGDQICKICHSIVEPGQTIASTGHRFEEGFCLDCMAEDPDYEPPEDPIQGIVPDPDPDVEYEGFVMSPMILACLALLVVAGAGLVVMIILVAKKK